MGLAAFLSCRDGSADNVLAHVVFLGQVEQLADLRGSLRSQSVGDHPVGDAAQGSRAFLHHNAVKNRDILKKGKGVNKSKIGNLNKNGNFKKAKKKQF
jgi:hypothetical protein